MIPCRLDPTSDFTVPKDGGYGVTVHDFLTAAARNSAIAGNLDRPVDRLYPIRPSPRRALKARTRSMAEIYRDRRLLWGVVGADGKPLEKLAVSLRAPGEDGAPAADTLLRPTDSSIGTFSYRLDSPHGISNPVRLALASGSLLSKQEPNDTPDKAQPLTVPRWWPPASVRAISGIGTHSTPIRARSSSSK